LPVVTSTHAYLSSLAGRPITGPFTGTHFPGHLARKRNLSRGRSQSNAARGPCKKAGVPLCVGGGSEPLTGYRYGNDPNRTASQV
jgi:hypothetical protein